MPDAVAGELCRNLGDDVWLKAAYRGGCQACQNLPKGAIRHAERYPVIAFRQPEAIDDPLTEVAREGARGMLAQVLIAEAASFIAMWKDLRLPDGRDRIVRRADGRDHARRGSLNRWHQEPSSDKFLVMCRHLECWQPRCQRRLRLTFFSLRWRSMAE